MVVFPRVVILVAMLGYCWAVPAGAQSPATPPANPPPVTSPPAASPPTPDAAHEDPFGAEVTMSEKTIVYFRGNGNWDAAFETIVDAFKTVNAFIAKQGLRPNGPAMTIYTATDDTTLGVHVVDLPTMRLRRGDRVDLTFYWPEVNRWEGTDFVVCVE